MNQNEWTLKDLFRTIGISFDLQKLLVAFSGLFLALLVYFCFAFLAEKTGGASVLFRTIGYILNYLIIALLFGALARMIAINLIEQRKAGLGEVFEFLSSNFTTLLFVPLAIVIIILSLLLLELFGSFIGAIPLLGPIFYSTTFLLHFFLSFIAVLCIVVAAIVLLIYPALIATKEVGVLEVLEELFQLAKTKGVFILSYELFLHILNCVVTAFLFALASGSVWLTAKIAQASMGHRFDLLVRGSSEYGQYLFHLLTQFGAVELESPEQISFLFKFAGLFFTISLILIVCLLLAYPIAFLNVGGVLIYFLVREEPEPTDEGEAQDAEPPSPPE